MLLKRPFHRRSAFNSSWVKRATEMTELTKPIRFSPKWKNSATITTPEKSNGTKRHGQFSSP